MNVQDLFVALQGGYGPSQALTFARNANQQMPKLGELTQPVNTPVSDPALPSNPSDPSSGAGPGGPGGSVGSPGFGGTAAPGGFGGGVGVGAGMGGGMGSASSPTGVNGMVSDPNGAATVAGLMADAVGMMSPAITGTTGFGMNGMATPNDVAQGEEAGVAGLMGATMGTADFGGWSGMDVATAIADAFSGYSESGFSGEAGVSDGGDGDGDGDSGW